MSDTKQQYSDPYDHHFDTHDSPVEVRHNASWDGLMQGYAPFHANCDECRIIADTKNSGEPTPSAAVSGAREWLWRTSYHGNKSELTAAAIEMYEACSEPEQVLQAYADHCTAQKEAELTAERTRREAAEREIEWRPIETAPKTGEHIIAARFTGDGVGFGTCGGKLQSLFCVVHWWDNPGEEGWYGSFGPDTAMYFTHWKPLREFSEWAALRGKGE